MSRTAIPVILLTLRICAAQTDNFVEADQALGQRLLDLQQLLHEDETHLKDMDHARRLEDLKPSIYGNDPGMELPGERAYTTVENFQGALDHFWLIICGALVMFMQAGFAMVEAGTCRAKNTESILLKNFTVVCAGALGWFIFGYSFAFSGPWKDGDKANGFMGYEEFAGHTFLKDRIAKSADGKDIGHMLEPTGKMLKWFFNWSLCCVAATIMTAGVAERINFAGYCIASFCMTAFIYPCVVAWTWGSGWLAGSHGLNDVGFMDFAGSGIIHLTGGTCALVGAVIAGARKNRFKQGPDHEVDQTTRQRLLETPNAFAPSQSPLLVLGTFILWFGWYGLNCGSTQSMKGAEDAFMAAHVAMNTTISASVSGLAVFFMRYAMFRKYDVSGLCNGILAGLVSISASGSNVESGSALLIGLLGAMFFQCTSSLLRILRVDDPTDAFAVHGACGWWGTMAAAFFDWGRTYDSIHAWSGFKCMGWSATVPETPCTTGLWGQLVAANFAEVGSIMVWAGILAAILFFVLRKAGLLQELDSEVTVVKAAEPVVDDDGALHIV